MIASQNYSFSFKGFHNFIAKVKYLRAYFLVFLHRYLFSYKVTVHVKKNLLQVDKTCIVLTVPIFLLSTFDTHNGKYGHLRISLTSSSMTMLVDFQHVFVLCYLLTRNYFNSY